MSLKGYFSDWNLFIIDFCFQKISQYKIYWIFLKSVHEKQLKNVVGIIRKKNFIALLMGFKISGSSIYFSHKNLLKRIILVAIKGKI